MSLMRSDAPRAPHDEKDLMVAMEDRRLIADTARERVFAEQYARLYPRMVRAASKVVPSDAHDVVQDAFLWYARQFEKLPPEQHSDALIWKAVRNAALNQLQRDRRLVELPDDESQDAIPVVQSEWSDDRELLWALIDALPPRCRLTFCLVRVMGASREDAAAELGVSLETVKTQLRRAAVLIAMGAERAGVALGRGTSTTNLLPNPGVEGASND